MSRIYDLRAWRRMRLEHLVREPLCRRCAAKGIRRPGHHVDHIMPINKGGAWDDPENLQSLCAECHTAKTNQDEGKHSAPYAADCDARGLPLDRTHPWNDAG